jgi:hypothetical protein
MESKQPRCGYLPHGMLGGGSLRFNKRSSVIQAAGAAREAADNVLFKQRAFERRGSVAAHCPFLCVRIASGDVLPPPHGQAPGLARRTPT